MDVRILATSHRGPVVAAGAFERQVVTFDLATGALLATFATPLQFGGQRLAIDPRGDRCAAAAWERLGVASFDARTGAQLWVRRSPTHVQTLRYSADGGRLYCGLDREMCAVLDAATGEDVKLLRAVGTVHESPFAPARILDARSRVTIEIDGRPPVRVPRLSFASLDVAFAPDAVCLSESGSAVRCLDLAGAERWRHQPPPGWHVLRIAHHAAERAWFGVEWDYEKGSGCRVLRLDAATGQREVAFARDRGECLGEFVLEGTHLLLANGDLIEVVSGRTVRHLAFDGVAPDT